ncbi:MAG: UvrD-helicase domain-containing protein [Burkholderiaceae bacterium]
MPATISISDEDIAYAERILLPAGESFDDERRVFIKNLNTIDLQAVPGSGKTTALLAKLLILDRHLPFSDGSGILVISHTNAAVDEIKGKIGAHCANLFRYPNFVGTIQGFVDEFLAVPYFTNRHKRPPVRIDDDVYNQKFLKPPFALSGFTGQENRNARHYLNVNANKKKIRWSLVNGDVCLTDGHCGKEIDFKKPRNNGDWSDAEKAKVREWISVFKKQILKGGYLCFDDAYFLASVFLSKNKHIKSLLQKRFTHVFVDEMQDMEEHQYSLLEELFFDGGASTSRYQRIGDKNQSIYGDKDTQNFWTDRTSVLQLNGSYRLSPILAGVIEHFAVTPIRIEGRRKNADGTDVAIKPHLIVFSDNTKESVTLHFAEIVKTLIEEKLILRHAENKYKAIAWAAQKEDGKLRLCDYHPAYSKEERTLKVDYLTLNSYIFNFNKKDRTFSSVATNINNALIKILREEGVVDSDGVPYSKRKLVEFLRENQPEHWAVHEGKLYAWCLDAVRGKNREVLDDIRSYIPVLLRQFDRVIKGSADFINSTETPIVPPSIGALKKTANVFRHNELEIDVSTVHGVKGETHTATLYLETFYYSHESERLVNQLKGIPIKATDKKMVKEAAKMLYVGFSRPTHLLCFAVHVERFAKFETGIDQNIWQIVRL